MKKISIAACLTVLAVTLTACGGSDTKETTVVHDRPVVVQSAPPSSGSTPSDIENACAHGYDNRTHSCY